jgi:hypothetical protein
MTLGREDFTSFKNWIKKISYDQPENQNPAVRCIMIPAPCQGIQLLLSTLELSEFLSLLECADTEMQALQLMDLFNR